MLKKVHESEDLSNLKSVIDWRKAKSNMMKNEDAVSLVLRSDLSQDQYNVIKSQSDSRSAHFMPNYDYMLDEKK